MLLFMLLPIKAGAAGESAEGPAYPAAPAKSYLKQKLLGASILALLATILISVLISKGIITSWLPHRF